ncbi:hypothetical protein H310_12198 [Aphanomyces invadans]|uniref:Cysteine/serine-rich nuclear protein N-terminal domain-containing protein n=1 Tax=Aphanomyces invadans TaxID=157072 RepID=A0A024TJR5_9STRA|nr:hypothetical protein H310_12198 [Aphanomyces invadans]ETV93846.1 hypothetical protein H310_12198 [Aphanomyces invadans]|eukprot:XP_008877406.1 hypothetical protein H310_12198 [Aphanomyces invadans]
MYTKLDMPNYAPSSPAAVDCDSVIVPSVRHAHRTVHFTTATTFVFPLTYGGSALPKDAGPPIGMTMDHSDAYVTDLSKVKHRRSRVRKFQHLERVALLKAAGVSPHDIAGYCTEAITIRTSRANTRMQW